ncbi:MAG: hypothetical protein DRO39_09400, partial [Thermoprotei archaeon]
MVVNVRDIDYRFIILNRSLYRLNSAVLAIMLVVQDLQHFDEYRDAVRTLIRYSRGLLGIISKLRKEAD